MVDSGAPGIGFINRPFVQQHGLKLNRLSRYIDVTGFTGKRTTAGRITHVASLQLEHKGHKEKISLFVTTLGKHDVILGLPWMKKHKVTLDWANYKLNFTAPNCKKPQPDLVREQLLPPPRPEPQIREVRTSLVCSSARVGDLLFTQRLDPPRDYQIINITFSRFPYPTAAYSMGFTAWIENKVTTTSRN
jgi:hypothetical protein